MAQYTKTELINDALDEIGAKDSRVDASGPDFARVKRVYDQIYDTLRDDDMVYWDNTDETTQEIPNAPYRALVNIVAGEICPSFGMKEPVRSDDINGDQVAISTLGWKRLKRHLATRSSGLPTKAEYF